ncbi:MAG: T9SS type A sorting domain-containing protein [Prevotellaceae bacterium]|jgi:hypothetical protein|nr:T9SS type A sorting domain-containing protein [Prevotellaceae bacterium]
MNAKKLFSIFAVLSFFVMVKAVDHGSMSIQNAPLYAQVENQIPSPDATPIDGQFVSFKLVTTGTKTYVWTELIGTTIMGESWSSQLRWWQPGKVENQLQGRITGTQQTFGEVNSLPSINPVTVTVFQHIPGEWVFRESGGYQYDYTAKNSANAADVTAPILADPVVANQTSNSLTLSLSAADASNDVFYYITDAANGVETVVFTGTATIMLTEATDYNLSIVAIDFSGNESAPKTVAVTGQVFVCNNLLGNKTLLPGAATDVHPTDPSRTMAPYFAPGWAPNNNYLFSVNGLNASITLNDATYEAWQAQFRIKVETPLEVTAGEKYSLLMDVETNQNTPFYVKFFDWDDNQFMEIGTRRTLNAGSAAQLAVYDITCPTGLTQIRQILFDFGGNAANTVITINNISVCGGEVSSVKSIETSDVKCFINNGELNINSKENIKSVIVYNIAGQTVRNIATHSSELKIDMGNETAGIYFVKIDTENGTHTHKVLK